LRDEQESSVTGFGTSAPKECTRPVQVDAASTTELIEVLDRFCAAFADRDAEGVMHLLARDPGVVVVTSEEPLLRGPAELKHFLDRYVDGPTTYSWDWDRHDVSTAGSVAWLLAEGIETAATETAVEQHPYRMTMVCERSEGRWLLLQVHGSSPH
jgi:ketosteroid isomerase-like protein